MSTSVLKRAYDLASNSSESVTARCVVPVMIIFGLAVGYVTEPIFKQDIANMNARIDKAVITTSETARKPLILSEEHWNDLKAVTKKPNTIAEADALQDKLGALQKEIVKIQNDRRDIIENYIQDVKLGRQTSITVHPEIEQEVRDGLNRSHPKPESAIVPQFLSGIIAAIIFAIIVERYKTPRSAVATPFFVPKALYQRKEDEPEAHLT
jgi:hypothetical protein